MTVTWDEFMALLAGISADTPLGRIVSIRAEKDPKVIRSFTREQRRIYSDWRKRSAESISPEKYNKAMAGMEAALAQMFG